jgi:hypothetical protein
MSDVIVPDGFLRFSDAVSRLAEGMWGGLRRPVPVQIAKQTAKKASIAFSPWREQAGQCLRAAAVKGELVVYVVAMPQIPSKIWSKTSRFPEQLEPVVVPVNVLKQLITNPRGGLPNHPIRPTIKTAGGDEKLYGLLIGGLLVVHARDFKTWYRSERAKGKWSSQRSRSKKKNGRPTKQTEAIRSAVLAIGLNPAGSSKVRIATLHRRLIAYGLSDIPSPDTLARVVDQLHRETGEPGLFRTARKRRVRT